MDNILVSVHESQSSTSIIQCHSSLRGQTITLIAFDTLLQCANSNRPIFNHFFFLRNLLKFLTLIFVAIRREEIQTKFTMDLQSQKIGNNMDDLWLEESVPRTTPMRDFYRGKVIFLTGGTGFLGQIYVEKLLR